MSVVLLMSNVEGLKSRWSRSYLGVEVHAEEVKCVTARVNAGWCECVLQSCRAAGEVGCLALLPNAWARLPQTILEQDTTVPHSSNAADLEPRNWIWEWFQSDTDPEGPCSCRLDDLLLTRQSFEGCRHRPVTTTHSRQCTNTYHGASCLRQTSLFASHLYECIGALNVSNVPCRCHSAQGIKKHSMSNVTQL